MNTKHEKNLKVITPLKTITAKTLLNNKYEPLQFAIKKLLPQGIFILAGSGKIGKSWLSLDMCISVATGNKLWDFDVSEDEVLIGLIDILIYKFNCKYFVPKMYLIDKSNIS